MCFSLPFPFVSLLFLSFQSGDKPSCRVGEIIKALHPGLQYFCRARVIDVRKYKLPEVQSSRWVVRVRWCDYWADEPDSCSIIEPTIAQAATIPQNKYLSFIQIVSNPFPYYPQYSEIYYQPEDGTNATAASQSSTVNVNTWQPGFVIEENEYQYHVLYLNPDWKPHPLLLLDDGEDEEDKDKLQRRLATEKARIKAEYKAELIRDKLKRDEKKRAKLRKERTLLVDEARAELERVKAQLALEEPSTPSETDADADDVDEKHSSPELEHAQKKLDDALEHLNAIDNDLLDDAEEPDEDGDNSDSEKRVSRSSAPSISKQPDTSLIYHIDYRQLDPTFIYDPNLARLDEDADEMVLGDIDEDGNGIIDDAEALEIEMGRPDPNQPQHPSIWFDENGEEKDQPKDVGDSDESSMVPVSTKKKKKNNRLGGGGFGAGDGGFYDHGDIDEDGDGDVDGDGLDGAEESDDPDDPSPADLRIDTNEDGGLDGALAQTGVRNFDFKEQQAINDWALACPKFGEAWVNKYSTRIKRQCDFFNTLYGKYLQGSYEETIEDKFFRVQRDMELALEAQRNKPKKWYHVKRDIEADTLKMMSKLEAQAARDEENAENARAMRDDTFEQDDTGLEVARRQRYEAVVEMDHKCKKKKKDHTAMITCHEFENLHSVLLMLCVVIPILYRCRVS